jgi:hypothetical protein
VNNDIEGLAPTQLSRFVFQKPTTNFSELDQLAALDQNLTFADHQRESEQRSNESLGGKDVSFQGQHETRQASIQQRNVQAANTVKRCFRCKQLGHLQRNCPRVWNAQGYGAVSV